MEQRRFVFKKDYSTEMGVIPKNSELRLFRGVFYLNGGMIHSAYQDIFANMVSDSRMRNEYLDELKIIQNKI